MECVQFESELQQRQDTRQALASPELEAHATNCIACRNQLMEALLLQFGVAAWLRKPPSPAADFADRLTAKVLAVSAQPVASEMSYAATHASETVSLCRPGVADETPRTWQGWAVLAASVAALWLVFAGSIDDRQQITATRPHRQATRPVPRPPDADFGTVLASAQGAYSHMANDSLAAAQDLALLWPVTAASADQNPVKSTNAKSTTAPSSSDDSNGAGGTWDAGLSDDLAPISNSVEDALNFLRRTMPQSQKSST